MDIHALAQRVRQVVADGRLDVLDAPVVIDTVVWSI